jgi:hypothetical protein
MLVTFWRSKNHRPALANILSYREKYRLDKEEVGMLHGVG